MIDQMINVKSKVKESAPLIHCITNPISINDCANAVLAVGAKPIMAEHPKEVEQITAKASALAVNLGNITDVRMKSIKLSGKVACNHIPMVIDLVGVACSNLRLEYAKEFIDENKPNVIKGNMSEIKAIAGYTSSSVGIDVGAEDIITDCTIANNLQIMKKLTSHTGAIIVATGKIDLIVLKDKAVLINNGVEMLSSITGTGCMLNVLIGSFISSGDILGGTTLAVAMLSVAGEIAHTPKGTGSFRIRLMDAISTMSSEQLKERLHIKEVQI